MKCEGGGNTGFTLFSEPIASHRVLFKKIEKNRVYKERP